jgi:hypothetical protein
LAPDKVQQVCELVFDYLGCIYLLTKLKQILQYCFIQKIESISKVEAKFKILDVPPFIGTLSTVVSNYQFRLRLDIETAQSQNAFISKVIEEYFNRKLERCFYNYKAVKGLLGILLTKLFTHIYVYELMHFELNPDSRSFLTVH